MEGQRLPFWSVGGDPNHLSNRLGRIFIIRGVFRGGDYWDWGVSGLGCCSGGAAPCGWQGRLHPTWRSSWACRSLHTKI